MKKKEGTVNLDLKRYHELVDAEKEYKRLIKERKDLAKNKLIGIMEFGALKIANEILKNKTIRLEKEIKEGNSKFMNMSLIQFYKWKRKNNVKS